jgi:hypothetical protein
MSKDEDSGANKKPPFNYRAVGLGMAVAPITFACLGSVDSIDRYVLFASMLMIVIMIFVTLILGGASTAQRLDPDKRKTISLASDFVVNCAFGHGIAFSLIRFSIQILHRFL